MNDTAGPKMTADPPVDLYGLAASQFGEDFRWGVATAAYQIEGAWDLDGKGPSIWDTFSHRRRWPVPTVARGETGDVACDFYHRYPEDLALLAEIGVDANRFSISWPRVLPEGTGPLNHKGLDFYKAMVDATLANGIEPWATLYHWDLPQALAERGGWANRDIVGWFEEYVGVMADALGDRVSRWMVFNEPASFCPAGYLVGMHAPGIMNASKFMASVHHVNLCQAVGARVLRAGVPDVSVGTTHILMPCDALSSARPFVKAAEAVDAYSHRIYIEPNLGLGYPLDACALVRKVEPFLRDGDDEAVKVDFDFFGLQYYTKSFALPVPFAGGVPIPKRPKPNEARTVMGWAELPEGLGEAIRKVHAYGRFPSIVITENGIAVPDEVEDGRVHDIRRIQYLRRHLAQVLAARAEGIPVDGYVYWSFLDNFEWAFGYKPRFGLVRVDFDTQERIPKDTAYWYRALLRA